MRFYDYDELVIRPDDGDLWHVTDEATGRYLATVPLSDLHEAQEAGINIRNSATGETW